MRLNKFLLTSAVIVPSLAPSLTLTSCSQTWGYLNPISFGSIDKGNANDPYQAFRSQTNVYFDANGQDITKYLQSNFIIDQAKSSVYAYTSPVTKWYETKDDVSGDEEPKVLPVSDWQRLNDGWKTSSDGISTSVTLDDPNPDKPDGVKKTYTNNENFNLVSNINFTSTIASTIANYLTYGLQYQASQINVNDKEQKKDLNAAWGRESSLLNLDKEAAWIDTGDFDSPQNRNFYEYIFASANSHSTGKTNSFLRPISANFNFESNYFPFPTYDVTTPAADDIDARVNVSAKTKKLLMNDDKIKFCQAGIGENTLAYYTDIKDQPYSIPYKTVTAEGETKWETYELTVKQYLFSSVPIVVDATNLSAKWVDPTKNDSFVPSDYFINDREIVNKAIGNSWEKISEFTSGDSKSTFQKFNFDLTKSGTNHRKFTVHPEPVERGTDPRIDDTMNGNSFVVLVSYVVNEFDSDKTMTKIKADFEDKGLTRPDELKEPNLAKLNAVSINSIESIFPAYLLSINDDNLFKLAHKDIVEDDITIKFGYIIDSSVVNKYNNKLLNLLKRTSQEGMKPHASDLNQESKDLLAFLGFMFASAVTTLSTDFLQTDQWQN